MGAIRQKLLSQDHEPEAHKHLFEQLIESNLVEMIKNGDTENINSLLLDVLGEGYELESLISVHP
jgi:precorrin-2 dehydrogenase/sirohydrochlorin ferrochelatase